MIYNPFTVPVRSALLDTQGNLTRPWVDWMSATARKTGRSMLWRGEYSEDLQYDVCDVVRTDDRLYTALQGNPVNGVPVVPGVDDTVWELVIAGIPAGGDEGEVLAKASGDSYDVAWVAAAAAAGGGPGGGYYAPLTDGNYNFIFGGDGDIVMVWVEP